MIFLLYLVFPIVEIYILIQAGERLGFWPIFGLVIFTAWLGSRLVKWEGFQILRALQVKVSQGQSPHQEMLEGLALMIGGVLLIAPGFITDFIGLLCLIPFTRKWMAKGFERWLRRKIKMGRIHVFSNFRMKDVTPPSSSSAGSRSIED